MDCRSEREREREGETGKVSRFSDIINLHSPFALGLREATGPNISAPWESGTAMPMRVIGDGWDGNRIKKRATLRGGARGMVKKRRLPLFWGM